MGRKKNVTIAKTYSCIALLGLNEINALSLTSILNIEAISLDEEASSESKQPTAISEAPSLKLLDSVDGRDQYEHLRQLFHIQKAMRHKR